MRNVEVFHFQRTRGIVWVCDIVGSSRYLNDNSTADDLEVFLPRLYWTAVNVVEAAGGKFIKWTGDGFLAWFETPLHRDLGATAATVFEAVWQLTLFINVTQLALSPQKPFRVRHGITYEHDALLTRITHIGGHESLDITGRAVVLAFRLSGISAAFPHIATQAELVNAHKEEPKIHLDFRKLILSAEDRLKYFKSEAWGTRSLFVSGERKKTLRTKNGVIRQAKKAIAAAEESGKPKHSESGFTKRFIELFSAGPDWCKAALDEEARFIREELLSSLKQVVATMDPP
jgi:class 3 adenylate cyclase